MNATPFLVAGYGITWAAILVYLLRLRRQERELARLRAKTDREH